MIKEFIQLNLYIKVRLLTSLVRKLSTDIMIPFITIYLSVHFSPFIAGLIILFILLLGTLFNLYGGILLSYIKITYILKYGEILHFVSVLMMMIFLNINSYIFVLMYLIKNIIFSFLIPFGEALVIENSNEKERYSIYSIEYVLLHVSLPISMIIGAILYSINFQLIILFSSVLILINAIIYFLFFKNNNKNLMQTNMIKNYSLKSYKIVLKNHKLILIILSAILLYSIEFSSSQLLPIYLVKLNLNDGVDKFVIFKTINSVTIIFISILFFKYIKKFSSMKYSIISMLFFLILFISLFYTDNIILFTLIGIGITIVNYIYSTYRKNLYMNNIDINNKGIFISAFSLTSRFGNILASLILIIYSVTDIYIISIILFMIGIISIYMFFKSIKL